MKYNIKIVRKGKSPLKLISDLHKEATAIVSDDLEYLRKELLKEAPAMNLKEDSRPSHIQPRGRKHLKEYLKEREQCKQMASPFSGSVFFDERVVPHIVFVIEKVKKHDISAKIGKLLKFWGRKTKSWVLTSQVKKSGGSSANDFIGRVHEASYSHIINTFIRRMGKALKK